MKDTDGGELDILESLSITVRRYRQVKSPLFNPQLPKEDIRTAVQDALKDVFLLCLQHDLIILDEFNYLFKENLITA
jgi:ATP:corrinoid adenosyltransferase